MYNVRDRMSYCGVPGVSVAVINGSEVEWAKGYCWSAQAPLRESTNWLT